MNSAYDCSIIGAGIIGTSIARSLSKYRGSVLLLEKGNDVALGATRASSGIVHGGYTSNSFQALHKILETARKRVPDPDASKLIRIFSGTRPSASTKDFIGAEGRLPGMIHSAGIDSPGLTSAPAIAEMVLGIMEKGWFLRTGNSAFSRFRKAITSPALLKPFREVAHEIDLRAGDPYRIACRCEQVTESTILDATGRNLPIHSLDAIKRRTRAGMGICQGKFCVPRVTELLIRSCHMKVEMIEMLKGKDLAIFSRLRLS